MDRIVVEDLTTDSSGDATAFTKIVNGLVWSIQYVKDDYEDGVDFTITGETTAQGIWTESDVNAAKTVGPSLPTHDAVGVASLFAATGEPVERPIAIVNERIKVLIASGGDTKKGTFHILIEGSVQGESTTPA